MMYIKFDGWIRDQYSFDAYNQLNGNPQIKWNGRTGPYHKVIESVMSGNQKKLTPEIADYANESVNKRSGDNMDIERFAKASAEEAAKMLRDALVSALKCKASEKQKGEHGVKVSYNGFTGELVKLEKFNLPHECGTAYISGEIYNLEIWDDEKKAKCSFNAVKLSDVKFTGGAVSFGG